MMVSAALTVHWDKSEFLAWTGVRSRAKALWWCRAPEGQKAARAFFRRMRARAPLVPSGRLTVLEGITRKSEGLQFEAWNKKNPHSRG